MRVVVAESLARRGPGARNREKPRTSHDGADEGERCDAYDTYAHDEQSSRKTL